MWIRGYVDQRICGLEDIDITCRCLALAHMRGVEACGHLDSAKMDASTQAVLADVVVIEVRAVAGVRDANLQELRVARVGVRERRDEKEGEDVIIENVKVPRAVKEFVVPSGFLSMAEYLVAHIFTYLHFCSNVVRLSGTLFLSILEEGTIVQVMPSRVMCHEQPM